MYKRGFSPILVAIVLAFLIILGLVIYKQFPTKGPEKGGASSETAQQTPTEERLVALGSSLTKASNLSTDMQGENNDYSFSTGTKIDSIYNYLKTKEKSLIATNLASPGAEMQDILERQLPEALKLNPKYVTIDPGADIVSKNSLPSYKKNLGLILDKINPEARVMIFTYPNFLAMRSSNNPSCQENKIGVKLENLSQENILLFNEAIKDLVKDKENVILVDIYNLFGPEKISDYDCLHFNINAQKELAAEFIKKLSAQGR